MAGDGKTIELEIRTPDEMLLREKVHSVRVQLADGWWGILPGHIPFIAALVRGILIYRKGKEVHYVVLDGGTLEVQRHRVMVLTPAAEKADDHALLRKKLEERKAAGEKTAFEAHIEFTRARTALLRALLEGARKG